MIIISAALEFKRPAAPSPLEMLKRKPTAPAAPAAPAAVAPAPTPPAIVKPVVPPLSPAPAGIQEVAPVQAPAEPPIVPVPAAPAAPTPPVVEPEIPSADAPAAAPTVWTETKKARPIDAKKDPLSQLATAYHNAGSDVKIEEILKEKYSDPYKKWLTHIEHSKVQESFRKWFKIQLWSDPKLREKYPNAMQDMKQQEFMTSTQNQLFEQALTMRQPWEMPADSWASVPKGEKKSPTLLKYVERMLLRDSKDPGEAPNLILKALDSPSDVLGTIRLNIKYLESYKPDWEKEKLRRATTRFQKFISDPSLIPDDIASNPALNADQKVLEAYKREAFDFGQPGRLDMAIRWWNEKYEELRKAGVPEASKPVVLAKTSEKDKFGTKDEGSRDVAGKGSKAQATNVAIMAQAFDAVIRNPEKRAAAPEGAVGRTYGEIAKDLDIKKEYLSRSKLGGKPGKYMLLMEMINPVKYLVSLKHVQLARKNAGVTFVSQEQLKSPSGSSYELEDVGAEDVNATRRTPRLTTARVERFLAIALAFKPESLLD